MFEDSWLPEFYYRRMSLLDCRDDRSERVERVVF